MNRKKALGRGIAAIIPTGAVDEKKDLSEISLDHISVNPRQPRKDFDEEKMMELVASISEHGIIQPITARKIGENRYELIAGERRYRACRYLKYDTIPTYIRDIQDTEEVMELALIENIQRANLNPIEEAEAYSKIIEKNGMPQETLAQRMGKKRSTITNSLRLLRLPDELLSSLISQKDHFTSGHARAVLSLDNEKRMLSVWNRILDQKLSVRKTEELVSRLTQSNKNQTARLNKGKKSKSPWQRQVEGTLQNLMGTRVQLKSNAKSEGKIEIEYYSKEDLDRLLDIFDSIKL